MRAVYFLLKKRVKYGSRVMREMWDELESDFASIT